AGLTAFYMFRTYFLVFEGKYKGEDQSHAPSDFMNIPLMALAVPSALIGLFLSGKFFMPSFEKYILANKDFLVNPIHYEGFLLPFISLIIALFGTYAAAYLYWDKFKQARKQSGITANNLIKITKPFYLLTTNLWYIDKFYYSLISKLFLPICNILSGFDKYVIDGLVNLTGLKVRFQGWLLSLFQTGQLQTHITVLFSGLIGLALIFIAFQWLYL
ncbi:MAG: hypothetical protein ACOCWG_06240, partial [bacterium]